MKKAPRFVYFGAAVFIFLAASYFFRPVWLPAVAQKLIVNEKPEKSDVIIVLNGHNVKMRLDHAVTLYKNHWAPKILLSGSWELEKETGINLAKVYVKSLGVPEEAILVENESRSTYENAVYARQVLQKNGYRSFILVTSPSHSLRARLMFKKVISSDIHWSTSVDLETGKVHEWWRSIELSREVAYEYLNLLFSWFLKTP